MGNNGSYEEALTEDTMISLEELIATCRTGDIILLRGKGMFSNIIRMTSGIPFWSHIGLVYRTNAKSEPMLFESTIDEEPFDLLTNTFKDGPKLSDLRSKIHDYGAYTVTYRKLHTGNPEQSSRIRKEWKTRLFKFIREVSHKHYETSHLQLLKSPFRANTSADDSSYFCTELTAEALVKMGILDGDALLSNNYTLLDFSEEGVMALLNSYYYDKQKYVK